VIQSLGVGAALAEQHSADRRAREAYDALAFAYDAFTAGYAHQLWLERLEALARSFGLAGNRVLDVACGTGKSFLPLLGRGYEVTGCDISESMLRIARGKAPEVRLVRADMRALPVFGAFDLVTCLDDALNYVDTEDELSAGLTGIARQLAPGGLALWDVNTLGFYRRDFASQWAIERDGMFMVWRGNARANHPPGAAAWADVDVFSPAGEGYRRTRSRHHQRHWPPAAVLACAERAGLRVLATYGQLRGATLEADLDELRHIKAVYLACPMTAEGRGGDRVSIGSP